MTPERAEWCREIDAREAELIASFGQHPVLAKAAELTRDQLLRVLLQRRFLSLAFTPLYELAIDALRDPVARRCLREIVREEYPADDQPTHREDLVDDLMVLGASREMVASGGPTPATTGVIVRLLGSLRMAGAEALYELEVLSFLRLAGEVLVAIEYARLWPRLEAFGLRGGRDSGAGHAATGPRSKFYYPHMRHDGRTFRFGDDPGVLPPKSHADRLTELLRQKLELGDSAGVAAALAAMERAAAVKTAFYDQFLAWVT